MFTDNKKKNANDCMRIIDNTLTKKCDVML